MVGEGEPATPTVPTSLPVNKAASEYNIQDVETIDVFQVPSDDLLLQASQSPNKTNRLAYPFRFRGNNHRLLLDTGADRTMVNEEFADEYQLD